MKFNSIYIIGATASGKSKVAIQVAQKLNGVIINADSMQVYKGANVVTASPRDIDKKSTPHKLYNVIDPFDDFNVIDWAKIALAETQTAIKNHKLPILCGGTGFYTNSFINGISPIPDVDENIRNEVRTLANNCKEKLYAELMKLDPKMAKQLQPNDTQRICRSLEIIKSTGKSLLDFQSLPKQKISGDLKPLIVGLLIDRKIVYDNINRRFEEMFDASVIEVEKLLEKGLSLDSQLMRAIGIPEIVKYIRGDWDKKTAIEKAQTATRRYAKRQMTFIRTQLNPDIVIKSESEIDQVINKFIN